MSEATVAREQLENYLKGKGHDPENGPLSELFDSMEEEIEQDEWPDLEEQFQKAGVSIEIAVVYRSSMKTAAMPQFQQPEEVEEPQAPSSVQSDPPPPLHLAPNPEVHDEEEQRTTLPHQSTPDPNADPGPAPQVSQTPRGSNVPLLRLGGLVIAAGIIFLLVIYYNKDKQVSTNPMVSTTPTASSKATVVQTAQPAPPKKKPAPPTPKQPITAPASTIVATCNITRYGLRDCTFQGNCTRSNTGSIYLEATCGEAQYRAQESERVLPLGEGRKVTLVKSGT